MPAAQTFLRISSNAMRTVWRSHDLLQILLISTAVFLASAVQGATIVLNNQDGAGEGFNDTTTVAAVGGNVETSLGAQRVAVFEYAAELIGSVLNSAEPISVAIGFDPLSCDASSATLGVGGPQTYHKDFPGAPQSQTLYSQAQTNSHLGSDIDTFNDDIAITLNGSLDNNNNCLNNRNWYYGLDGNPPTNDIDLLTTIMHEIVHGLGFDTLVDLNTGSKSIGCLPGGCDDAYMLNIEDHSIGKTWPQMSNSERLLSSTDDPDLHFTGSNVQANLAGISGGLNQGHARLHGPSPLVQGSSVSHFSLSLSPFELMEPQISDSASSLGLATFVLQDMGWSVAASPAPILSTPADQLMLNSATLQVDIALLDNDDDAASLSLSASSSNPSIIPGAGLVTGGSGRLRTLDISPNSGTTGSVTVTLSASDGSNLSNQQFIVNVTDNLPPSVSISTPADAAVFYNNNVGFAGSATDPEQGNISAGLAWTSSIDGAIGSGASFSTALGEGNHLIDAAIIDNAGNPGNASITITVDTLGDVDGDGLSNSLELALGTNPEDSDSDDDFSSDFDEVNRDGNPNNYTPGVDTDPNNPDTDGDSILDGADFAPLDPSAGGAQVPFLPMLSAWLMSAALLAIALYARSSKSRKNPH